MVEAVCSLASGRFVPKQRISSKKGFFFPEQVSWKQLWACLPSSLKQAPFSYCDTAGLAVHSNASQMPGQLAFLLSQGQTLVFCAAFLVPFQQAFLCPAWKTPEIFVLHLRDLERNIRHVKDSKPNEEIPFQRRKWEAKTSVCCWCPVLGISDFSPSLSMTSNDFVCRARDMGNRSLVCCPL